MGLLSTSNPLAPYLLYIKLGVAAIILGGMFFFGRSCGVDSMQEKYDKQVQTTATVVANSDKLAIALKEANMQTEANQQAAREQAKHAEQVVKENEKIKDDLWKKQSQWDMELEAAKKKDPDCADLLKRKVCIAF